MGKIEKLTKAEMLRLSIILLPNLMISLNTYMLQVALPEIQKGLGSSFSDAQFVLTGYSLGLASFLIISSFLGNRLGQKKVLLTGIILFMLLCLIGGSTSSVTVLILVRIGQGIAGALIQPQVMVLMREGFSVEKQSLVFGIYGMVIGLGFTFGLLLGGFIMKWNLVDLGWRNIFFINIPFCLLIVCLQQLIPKKEKSVSGTIDKSGSLLLIVGSFLLVYQLIYFVGVKSTLLISLSLIVLVIFYHLEKSYLKKEKMPLVDVRVFKEAKFLIGLLSVFSVYVTMFSLFFLMTYYAQEDLGKTVFQTGFIFLPLGIGFTVASITSSKVLKKIGNHLLIIGVLGMIASLCLLSFSVLQQPDLFSIYNMLLLALYGVFLGFTTTPLVGIILIKVSSHYSAVASSLINMTMYFANILGVALLSQLFKLSFVQSSRFVYSLIFIVIELLISLIMITYLCKKRTLSI